MLFLTSAKSVGFTKNPSSKPSGFPGPPVTTRAPSATPCFKRPCTRSHCTWETTGPMFASGSSDRPTLVFSKHSFAMLNASSYLERGTNMRLKALHDWPVLEVSCPRNFGMTALKSASSSMTAALLPPSSVRTRFKVDAAAAEICFPARVEPVKLTMSTSGCSASTSPHPGPKPTTMLKTPAGIPASWIASATMYAQHGVISLGFKTTVHPASIAGIIFSDIWLRG
mmetsp:Transcript_108959/g.216392  ORF Transcript_108959/g.216392 Transcript_108959/m.216392 type:complete len:226 (-) Transcript_108959:489-1166(-)